MDKQSKIALTVFSVVLVAGATIGSLSGLWLSSRILSPLAAGGVLGAVVPALLLTFYILSSLKKLYEGNGKREDLKEIFDIVAWTATSVLVGVGLGFAANAIFPGVMLAMGSPALVGAVIGAIAPLAGFFAFFCVITPLAEKVNEYIISPIVECFSSRGKEIS